VRIYVLVVSYTGFRHQPHITEGLGFGLICGTTFQAVESDVALGSGRAECVRPCSLNVLCQEERNVLLTLHRNISV
jgi:hypothetical protein